MKYLTVVLLIGSAALPVLADIPKFNFTYSDANYTLSGILTATSDPSAGTGAYLVTDVTGTVSYLSGTPYALTLVPAGAVPSNANGDNVYGQDDLIYFNQAPLLTVDQNYNGNGGIEFAFPAGGALTGYNGGSDIALFANNSTGGSGNYGSYESGKRTNLTGGYGKSTAGGTFTLSAVPDGGTTLVLLGLAVAGLAGLRRKLSA